jgi:hypothetical protein
VPRPPVPESIDADVIIVGDGLPAWACVREIARRGRSVAVLSGATPPSAPVSRPVRAFRPVAPRPSYVDAVQHYGRESARSLWESFREDGDAVGRLAVEVGCSTAVERGGGFVLARSRSEALDLAEGEDLLREDGFSGEFLDHFLLEARFDVREVAAGYWAVDDLSVDEGALVDALRAEHREVSVRNGEPLSLELGPRVTVEMARARVRAECLVVAVADPRVLPGFPLAAAFRDEAWAFAEYPLPAALSLPCPARSWDGRRLWQRSPDGVRALMVSTDEVAPLDWVAREAPAPSRQERGVTAVSRDGLPLIGAVPGCPVFLLHGGSGLDAACAVAGARWMSAAALDGRDECPALLRAGRLDH